MNNKQKSLNLLGLALKAGKMQSGQPTVIKSIRSKAAELVIVTEDASKNTKKNIIDKANHYNIPVYVLFTKNELSNAIGKNRTVCTILDKGFAESFEKLQ